MLFDGFHIITVDGGIVFDRSLSADSLGLAEGDKLEVCIIDGILVLKKIKSE